MTYANIARVLQLPYATVQHICRYKPIPQHRKKYGGQERKLDQQHIDFLISPETLKLFAGATLKERTILFHRKFPNKKIAVTSLRCLYLKNRVKRKAVR